MAEFFHRRGDGRQTDLWQRRRQLEALFETNPILLKADLLQVQRGMAWVLSKRCVTGICHPAGDKVSDRGTDVTIKTCHDRTISGVILSASNKEGSSVDDGVLRQLPPVGAVLDQQVAGHPTRIQHIAGPVRAVGRRVCEVAVGDRGRRQPAGEEEQGHLVFARHAAETYGIDAKACSRPEEIYEGADIVAACTDSAVTVLDGTRIEKGAHVINIGGSGVPDEATLARIDVYLRFGDAPAPTSNPALQFDDEHLGWEARPQSAKHGDGRPGRKRGHGVLLPEKRIALADLVHGKVKGRTSGDQITYSERGNLQGAFILRRVRRIRRYIERRLIPRRQTCVHEGGRQFTWRNGRQHSRLTRKVPHRA